MPTREEILAVLATVRDPEIGKPITELDMVKEVTVDGDSVIVEILLTVAGCPMKDRIRREVTDAVLTVHAAAKVHVELGVMTDEQRQTMVGRLKAGQPSGGGGEEKPIGFWQPGSKTRAILVASGKGGVGKSSLTANLAVALAQRGHKVGVVDCDVYGYSIPKMLGVTGRPVAFEGMFLPLEGHGVKVVSMGFFVPEDQPVIWRGPMLHKALHQFLADAYWGDDIEYILLDMPPGTGDVAISIAQYLPGAEMLVVTTPQEAAQTVAVRAGRMTDQVNLKVIGVVENMSTFICPGCDEAHHIFGAGGGQKLAESLNSKVLAEVPIDVRLRQGGDEGKPVVITDPDSPASRAIFALADHLATTKPSLKGKKLSFTVN